MDIRQCLNIEVKKGDFVFHFMLPSGSTWGNALDAAFDFLDYVNKKSQESVAQAMPQPVESPIDAAAESPTEEVVQ